ncbi:glycosyltransferase family 4 protein [Brachybacterium ginsengisoli]|uniref:glycosyltransferase family 4 protein n=1 Tax=Brachybacterium ginsengisoli TaxID=1331682 RepID=UPI001D1321B7|nr:glycosyltransferase family 4 protein [Brachybacterium ginsengisoli]
MNENRTSPPPSQVISPQRPLRVLLTTDWWEPVVNGVVASVQTLRRELIALGCDVRVLTLSQGLRSRNEEGVYRLGSVSASMVYDRARIGMPTARRVLRDVLDWRPDVVHSQAEFSTYVWARRIARTLSIPLVHTYHTIYEDYTHYYSPSRTMGRKVVETFSRRVLSRTDAVIVPTQKVSRLLTGYGVLRPLHVIPTGLDLERFRPARTEEEHADARALRASLGIEPGRKVLLSVSRLAKEKNLDEVLDMVAVADREDTVLVLVGDGPYRPELEARAASLGITDRVRFTGVVAPADIPRWYRMGDVFVGASLSETQGLTFIEAMACGLPLLCRRDPSLASVVVEGVTGWQFEGAAQFTSHLSALLDDPIRREQMSRAALDRALDTCDAKEFGRGVLRVYQEARGVRAPVIARREPVAA